MQLPTARSRHLPGRVRPVVALALLASAIATFPATARAQSACDVDVDRNGSVGASDLATLLSAWGTCPNCAADINRDGTVNGADLSSLLGLWGATCSPLPWATVLEFAPNATVVTNSTLRNAITASGLPWRIRDNASQIEMTLIPPGTFSMGCTPSNLQVCDASENPVHTVTITKAFYMGRTEVTQLEWGARMGSNPSRFQGVNYPDWPLRPVESVSWNTVQGFLSATGLRLPTEAEWEYACRAGTTTAFHSMPGYPNGTNDYLQIPTIGWIDDWNSWQTHPVAQKAQNAFGLFDTIGNVNEWVSDWWSDTYYAQSVSTDPQGPASGSYRVTRGGSWLWGPDMARASARFGDGLNSGWSDLGFRVARTAVAPPSITSVSPNSGFMLGGTAITITGSSFTGATSVTIGGNAATAVAVVNDRTITAITPPGSVGARDVRVTTAIGTGTAAGAFTYSAVPSWATLLEFAPNPAVVTNASLRNAIVATGLPWRVRDNSSQIEMLLVPPGSFDMGCSPLGSYPCLPEENPVHPVTLTNAFYIGRYEVTQAEWNAKITLNPSFHQGSSYPDAAQRPVEGVVATGTFWSVDAFLAATGLRLPTEAEWEYAYRAGTSTAFHSLPGFPNGTSDPAQLWPIAWFAENSGNQTHVVGQKAANALGIHDMSGNVLEWVADRYSATYYSSSPTVNPVGPATGTKRVVRGGGWRDIDFWCRSSGRIGLPDFGVSGPDTGFRVARNP